MKIIVITFALTAAAFAADSIPLNELVTVKGKAYSGVKVTKIEPDGIRIVHDGGLAKVVMEDLPESWRERFNFDPAAAEQYRLKAKAAQRKLAEARQLEAEAAVNRAARQLEIIAPAEGGPLPAPFAQPKLYDVEDLKAMKADLAGKVVRVTLYSGANAPEQNTDRSYQIMVGGNSNRDDRALVLFPPGTGPVVRTFRELRGQTLKFYVLIVPEDPAWIRVIGVNYDPQRRIYTW